MQPNSFSFNPPEAFDLQEIFSQTQSMQQQMQAVQADLAAAEVTETGGDGMVSVTLGARGDVRAVSIDPKLLDPQHGATLEAYVAEAFTNANKAMQRLGEERMRPFTEQLGAIGDMFGSH